MARTWRCGRFDLSLRTPCVMGVLNVTPDSFSDGGAFADHASALAHGRGLAAAGACIIDVGGESTRPGSAEVSTAEEIRRTRDVVSVLAEELGVPISIDTRHPEVALAALGAGASVINDVSGFRDPAMVHVAASSDAGLVVMHMQGEPRTMQTEPHYEDVVAEVGEYLLGQARMLESAGVARERICLDPGIGFGKTLEHNLELLRRLSDLADLGYPLLIGVSRKSMIGALTDEPDPRKRLEGSLAAALWAVSAGADVVRVHDVRETLRALKVWSAIEGEA
ncbi:MAG: dihydropteroate synthase [Coriobacteriales bacterium]|nr:dihydropteroate synthase [Actinomycetes bacterium]